MPVLNLTEARIRKLGLGSGIHRYEQVKGLMVICHRTTKTDADDAERTTFRSPWLTTGQAADCLGDVSPKTLPKSLDGLSRRL